MTGRARVLLFHFDEKELLAKRGLKDSERKRILDLLSGVKILKVDHDVQKKYWSLVQEHGDRPESLADYIIAATAWSKGLALLTRNTKHFRKIKQIILAPTY